MENQQFFHNSDQTDRSPTTNRYALGLIFSIMLMDIVGLTGFSPVTPYLVQRYNNAALAVTMVTVVYAAAQFLATPLMGKLGDRYGRRPILLISLFGQAIGYAIFGVGGALWVLYLGRLIGGITGGNMSTANAYIADISKPEERAKNFTLIGIAWSLGLILGPAVGGALGQVDKVLPAFVAAGLSFLNVLFGFFMLPESLPKERRNAAPMRVSDFNPVAAIIEMARKPGLAGLLVVNCLFNFAFMGISSTSTLFYIEKFAADPGQLGTLMALAGISLAVVQFLLVQRVVKRYGEKRVAVASLIGQVVGDLAIFFAPTLLAIYIVNMFVTATSGFTFPTLTTLNTSRVQHREVGLLMGVTSALGSLMNIIGPVWGGIIYDRIMIGSPYWMGAVILVLAAGLLLKQPGISPATVLPVSVREE
jgi:DHA1 family tetracycline resistance protein-like MFS transporter